MTWLVGLYESPGQKKGAGQFPQPCGSEQDAVQKRKHYNENDPIEISFYFQGPIQEMLQGLRDLFGKIFAYRNQRPTSENKPRGYWDDAKKCTTPEGCSDAFISIVEKAERQLLARQALVTMPGVKRERDDDDDDEATLTPSSRVQRVKRRKDSVDA